MTTVIDTFSIAATQVAVGVVLRGDEVLVAVRPQTASLPGLWEFPGGKVEAGESIWQALCREMQEEVGISVERAEPWLRVEHDYGKGRVVLHVWRVLQFSGQAYGKEGQQVQWMACNILTQLSFPAANAAIIQAILAL